MNDESRRQFFLSAIGMWQTASFLAQKQAPLRSSSSRAPSFLDDSGRKILRRLMSRIIPADERSGGASSARVDEYIDFVLTHADPALQNVWRKGLDDYGMAIESASDTGIDAFLAHQAQNEFSPTNMREQFFVHLKTAVTEGFYTSQEAISKELGYQGMTFQMDFIGCTHPDHKAPPDYKPLLRQKA
jgi:hypothetical protein